MAWDEDGNLHCGNEQLYGCEPFPNRGGRGVTDARARLYRWRIWGEDVNCPDCSKSARGARRSGVIVQEGFPLDFGVPVEKKSRKKTREHS